MVKTCRKKDSYGYNVIYVQKCKKYLLENPDKPKLKPIELYKLCK